MATIETAARLGYPSRSESNKSVLLPDHPLPVSSKNDEERGQQNAFFLPERAEVMNARSQEERRANVS
jgi:hypothetical protein